VSEDVSLPWKRYILLIAPDGKAYPVKIDTATYQRLVGIDLDNVGLAKDATLSGELTRVVKGDQGVVKQVSAADLRLDVRSTIEGDTVGLAKDATLTSALSRNVAQWGGTAQTGFDFEGHVPFIGAHRLRGEVVASGSVTVLAGTTLTWLSVSGIGRFFVAKHASVGVVASKAQQRPWIVGDEVFRIECRPIDVISAHFLRMRSVGWYINSVYVYTWDTVNNNYSVMDHMVGKSYPYRDTLDVVFTNFDTTTNATMVGRVVYSLFSASKRILVKLPRWNDALALRKESGVARLKGCPIVVYRLGYYEIEEEHPYREWLDDLPNKWDRELPIEKLSDFEAHIAGRERPEDLAIIERGGIIRSATEEVQNFVAEIYAPDEMTVDQALGKIKPVKVLHEEKI